MTLPAAAKSNPQAPTQKLTPAFFDVPGNILTVGDGDLSFSEALLDRLRQGDSKLTATVYDTEDVLVSKYAGGSSSSSTTLSSTDRIAKLCAGGADVRFSVDARRLTAAFSSVLAEEQLPSSQQRRTEERSRSRTFFSRIVFQMPLLPAMTKTEFETAPSKDPVLNNRLLLYEFLAECWELLSPNGIAVITSKDVRPYTLWRLHDSVADGGNGDHGENGNGNRDDRKGNGMRFLGKLPFFAADFPGYRFQNVDRDKNVKDTNSFSFLYCRASDYDEILGLSTTSPPGARTEISSGGGVLSEEFLKSLDRCGDGDGRKCAICDVGPFTGAVDRRAHLESKKHLRFVQTDEVWARLKRKAMEERRRRAVGCGGLVDVGCGGGEEVVLVEEEELYGDASGPGLEGKCTSAEDGKKRRKLANP
eukprot:g15224.t1